MKVQAWVQINSSGWLRNDLDTLFNLHSHNSKQNGSLNSTADKPSSGDLDLIYSKCDYQLKQLVTRGKTDGVLEVGAYGWKATLWGKNFGWMRSLINAMLTQAGTPNYTELRLRVVLGKFFSRFPHLPLRALSSCIKEVHAAYRNATSQLREGVQAKMYFPFNPENCFLPPVTQGICLLKRTWLYD